MSEAHLIKALDRLATAGRTVKLWLRDDDAVSPSTALDTLLAMTAASGVPVTLAVIPQDTGAELANRLDQAPHASVAVHGWSHANHAPGSEKKQELGSHRPTDVVLSDLKAGFDKLQRLHGQRFVPMLVPPWNRIAADLLPRLEAEGFALLSVFGRERPGSPIPLVNTHVDIMDWHGTRGGRPMPVLFQELADQIESTDPAPIIGVLTHHLVHDAAAWEFLDRLFAIAAAHPACQWVQPRPA